MRKNEIMPDDLKELEQAKSTVIHALLDYVSFYEEETLKFADRNHKDRCNKFAVQAKKVLVKFDNGEYYIAYK